MIIKPKTDKEFFEWVERETEGFFVNLVNSSLHPEYPRAHRTAHTSARTRKRKNYTNGKPYLKWCSTDIKELDKEAHITFDKGLTFCRDKSCFL